MTFNSQTCLRSLITKICSSGLHKAAHCNQHLGKNKTWCMFATPHSTALQMVLLQLRFWSAVKAGVVWTEGKIIAQISVGLFWSFIEPSKLESRKPCSVCTHLVVLNNRLSSTLRIFGVCLKLPLVLLGRESHTFAPGSQEFSLWQNWNSDSKTDVSFASLEWALEFSWELFCLFLTHCLLFCFSVGFSHRCYRKIPSLPINVFTTARVCAPGWFWGTE